MNDAERDLDLLANTLRGSAQIELEAATVAEARGDMLEAALRHQSALCDELAAEIRQSETDAAFELAMQRKRLESRLQHVVDLLRAAPDVLRARKLPAPALGGNYQTLGLVHLGWAIGAWAIGEELTEIAGKPEFMSLVTPFWREYARGLVCLIADDRFEPDPIKLHPGDRYSIPYLALMRAMTERGDPGKAVELARESFARRNRDRRLGDDPFLLAGTGVQPARIDFRRTGLVAYGTHRGYLRESVLADV